MHMCMWNMCTCTCTCSHVCGQACPSTCDMYMWIVNPGVRAHLWCAFLVISGWHQGCSTASALVMATKRSFVKNELGPPVNAARLEYTHGTMLGDTTTTRGRVPVKCQMCILQARGVAGAPSSFFTNERFVAVTRLPPVEQPCNGRCAGDGCRV